MKALKKIYCDEYSEISFETGTLAQRADGSVVVRTNDGAVVLVTVVFGKNDGKKSDFLPLYVSYQEKYSAVGKIPPSSVKREGKLNDHEVLISRLVDRGIRPLFSSEFRSDVNVNISLLSANYDTIPEDLACYGTSLALLTSGIGFSKPVSETSVWFIDNRWTVNPKRCMINDRTAKIVVCGTKDHIVMLEGYGDELSEDVLLDGVIVAMARIAKQCQFQEDFCMALGIELSHSEYCCVVNDEELTKRFYDVYSRKLDNVRDKDNSINDVESSYVNDHPSDDHIGLVIKESKKKAFLNVVANGCRIDGRTPVQIRNISSSVGYLPRVHGSALFTRGETQALVSLTLGDRKSEQLRDGVMECGYNDFILHYNFHSYATGELSNGRGVSRREIGHGNLAYNGVRFILPDDDRYVIRIVSDILSSNGSSSMATVCGSSLALMDAGINVKRAVAGIAMGLVLSDNGNFYILSDISDDEDKLGDMDFKVVGTDTGVTAIQLDVKKLGLNISILRSALQQAKEGRSHILSEMNKTISAPRSEKKDFVPRWDNMRIEKKDIGRVIGVGGNVIQRIQRETNSVINISETREYGDVRIFSSNKQGLEEAKKRISDLLVVPDTDTTYDGTVKEVLTDRALVEFLPGKVGMLRSYEVDIVEINDLTKVLNVGDSIEVKVVRILDHDRYLLSHRVLLPNNGNHNTLSSNNDNNKQNVKQCYGDIPDNV